MSVANSIIWTPVGCIEVSPDALLHIDTLRAHNPEIAQHILDGGRYVAFSKASVYPEAFGGLVILGRGLNDDDRAWSPVRVTGVPMGERCTISGEVAIPLPGDWGDSLAQLDSLASALLAFDEQTGAGIDELLDIVEHRVRVRDSGYTLRLLSAARRPASSASAAR